MPDKVEEKYPGTERERSMRSYGELGMLLGNI
jgi:hypothetical protein